MTRFLRSPKFPIFLIVFVDVIGLGITIPVLPVYAEGYFNLSGIEIAGLPSLFFFEATYLPVRPAVHPT